MEFDYQELFCIRSVLESFVKACRNKGFVAEYEDVLKRVVLKINKYMEED